MVHDLLSYALLLMGILWLSVILIWLWPPYQAAPGHTDRQPAHRAPRRLQDPKPFSGGSDIHLILALRRRSRQVVVADKQLDGTNMMGELFGTRQRFADQP